jgi:hypothetical protein
LRRIGNDIVDLSTPENRGRARNRRFLERIFTPDEQDDIRQAAWPDAFLWALWAGKEAAYKALSKNDPAVPSIPKEYPVKYAPQEVDADGGTGRALWTGVADTPGGKIHLRTVLNSAYVHCLASTASFPEQEQVLSRVIDVGDEMDVSPCLRRAAVDHIAALLGIPSSHAEIQRSRSPKGLGPPCVLVEGRLADVDISLSHDGRYGAFVIRCGPSLASSADRRPSPCGSPL